MGDRNSRARPAWGRDAVRRYRVLVMTGFESLAGFLLPMEHRSLLWGFDQANIDWYLYNPWRPMPALAGFDGMYISVYRFYNKNFVYHGSQREREARERGLPVLNTVEHAHSLHSYSLSRWRERGVPCARFQHFGRFEDISLSPYPLVLRRDGMHRGSGMFLVRTATEARRVIERQIAESRRTYPSARGVLPLNLAIEFIETERAGGYFHKFRSYVVGDEVIPAHFMRSRSAFVNYKDAALWDQTCSLDQTFRLEGEPHPERVVAAARAVDLDIVALDYSRRPDGSYVFWEGNRVRATAGDAHVSWLDVRETDIRFGTAVARLMRSRIEAQGRGSPGPAPIQAKPAARPPAQAFLR